MSRGINSGLVKTNPLLINYQPGKFPLSKNSLGISVIISFLSFWSLTILSNRDINASYTYNFRIAFFTLGPILAFIFYSSLILYFYYEHVKDDDAITDILSFAFVGGLISIIFAISINSITGTLIISLFDIFFNINEEDSQELILIIYYGIIAAFTEEIAKSIPIFIMSRGLFTYWGKTERRFFNSMHTIFITAFIIGGLFSFLETYWYMFNLSYLYEVKDPEIWNLAYGQIMIRSISPLHISTSAIMAYGIALSLYFKRGKILSYGDYSPYYISLIGATILHGLWNGTLVYSEFHSIPLVTIFGQEIPRIHLLYIAICLILIGYFGYFLKNKIFQTCNYCNEKHIPPFTKEDHINTSVYKINFRSFISRGNENRCKYCKKGEVFEGVCNSCNSTIVFLCGHCKSVIPVNAESCWNCNYEISAPYNSFFTYKEDAATSFSIGLFKIFGSLFVISPLIYFVNGIRGGFNDKIMVLLFFLLLLGLAFTVTFSWLNNPMKKSLGIAVARIFIAVIIFQISFFTLTLGNLFFGAFEELNSLSSKAIFMILLYYLESIILMFWGFIILTNFQPLVHGGSSSNE